jgi:hypothetical protein
MLPVMSNPQQWSLKSEPILIAYVLSIYEYIYLQQRDVFNNELETLQKTMVVKTRDSKFVSLGSPDVVVHLSSKYSPKLSLTLPTDKLTFISDDYYKLVITDISRSEGGILNFINFLRDLNVNEFFRVNVVVHRE